MGCRRQLLVLVAPTEQLLAARPADPPSAVGKVLQRKSRKSAFAKSSTTLQPFARARVNTGGGPGRTLFCCKLFSTPHLRQFYRTLQLFACFGSCNFSGFIAAYFAAGSRAASGSAAARETVFRKSRLPLPD